MRRISYLLYRRIRPSLGLTLGFVVMSSLVIRSFDFTFFIASLGFFFIALYGDFYNDYWDYDEDVRNGRKDKLTTTGILTREQAKHISFLLVAAGLGVLWSVNIILFLLGSFYSLLLIFYSHPSVRLKGKVRGYIILSSFFFLLPFGLLLSLGSALTITTLLFGFFFFFQYIYILCQKDSTDTKDDMNIFLGHRWVTSSFITMIFGFLASLSLLLISFLNPAFMLFWVLNFAAKVTNIQKIIQHVITRSQRQVFVLLEFITPYLYYGGGMIV